MIIPKTFLMLIPLTDIGDKMSSNYKETCLNFLIRNFVNKCYKGSFILNINRILNMSLPYVMENDPEATININVEFEAMVVIYIKEEIITRCKIVRIETSGEIYAESLHANIILEQSNVSATVGDTIPTIVQYSSYNRGENKIAIYAYPFVPKFPQDVCYKITLEMSNYDFYDRFYNMIKIEEEKQKSLNNEIRNFFTNLLHPFKEEKKIESKNLEDFVNLRNIDRGYICRPLRLRKEVPMFWHSDTPYPNSIVVENDMDSVAYILLLDYLHYITKIVELSTEYDTLEKTKKRKQIWGLYSLGKK